MAGHLSGYSSIRNCKVQMDDNINITTCKQITVGLALISANLLIHISHVLLFWLFT